MNSDNHADEFSPPPQDTMPEELVDTPINYDEDAEDPLKRHAKFSWKSFGGDGFIVSIIFHAVLIIFALFYVVATIQPAAPEPQEFVSGSGGGSDGENANRQQHRMRQRPRDMATQNKITSKNARATLTLPEIPKVSSSLGAMSSMKAGGASSGTGGGAGGGIGTGIGVGIGNGSAFLSAFGTSFSTTPTLKGTLYDLKRSRDGKTEYSTTAGGDAGRRKAELHRALGILDKERFNTSKLGQRYYAARVKLNANQVYIYKDTSGGRIEATAATKAFAGEDGKPPFDAPGWMVVYEGDITPPETGEYRFVGMGDDAIIVGLRGETVFYGYWPGEGHGQAVNYKKGWLPENHCGPRGTDGQGSGSGGGILTHIFKGSWVKLVKGQRYKICIAFGEGAGGYAGAVLGIEKKGAETVNGKTPIFKLASVSPELLKILFIEGRYTTDGPTFMLKKSR